MKITDLYTQAQIDINIFTDSNLSKDEILEYIYNTYKTSEYVNRKLELLKQYCIENDIDGVFQDFFISNSHSTKYNYNNKELINQLKQLENETKNLVIELKKDPLTEKEKTKIKIFKKRQL